MRNGAFARRPIIPRVALSISTAREICHDLDRSREMEIGMSDSGSRGGSVPSEFAPPASGPTLSDIEAIVVASAVLGLAFAILT
jgi:hypothetical protein